MIYLDYLSTTPCDPRVVQEMLPFFTEQFGNPHSQDHFFGRAAADAVDLSRKKIAHALGVDPREIIFTSGATEADNLAIKGAVGHLLAQGDPRRRVITAATEHKSVLEAVLSLRDAGCEPFVLPVASNGRVAIETLREALRMPTLLVSIMGANNETGVMEDLSAISSCVRAAGAIFHSDMAQLLGKGETDLALVDLASFSGHKIYGPKGIGALFVRRRPRVRLLPLFSGGGQERGVRSGTLPTPLVVGFASACALISDVGRQEQQNLGQLRDQLFDGIEASIPGVKVNGGGAPRLANVLNVQFPPGFVAKDMLDAMTDISMSTGSACTSSEVGASYILQAMGLSFEEASRSLRLSVGRFTTRADIAQAVEIFARYARAHGR